MGIRSKGYGYLERRIGAEGYGYLEIRTGAGDCEYLELGLRAFGAKCYRYLKLKVTGIWS